MDRDRWSGQTRKGPLRFTWRPGRSLSRRFSRLGLQRRIMLYVTLGLATMFGTLADGGAFEAEPTNPGARTTETSEDELSLADLELLTGENEANKPGK